jgi:hypothetical protein
MLAGDTKQRREAALDSDLKTQQTKLGDHFSTHEADAIPYSDKAFEVTAIELLIQTNQVSIPLLPLSSTAL